MSKQDAIAKAFALYKDVFAYGVDGNSLVIQPASEVAISRKVFFEQLYEPRNRADSALAKYLSSGERVFWIIGRVGTGKSTVAHRAIMEYSAAHDLPEIVVDFKVVRCVAHTTSELSLWLEQVIRKHADEYCNKNNITQSDLALTFFLSGADSLLSAGPASHARRAIYNAYVTYCRDQTAKGLPHATNCYDWIHPIVQSGDMSTKVGTLIDDLGDLLNNNIIDKLIAISLLRAPDSLPENRRLHTILFDNLDCIDDLQTRNQVRDWLRNKGSPMFIAAKFLATVRPENDEAYFSTGVAIATADMLDPQTYADHAYHVGGILLDEFADDVAGATKKRAADELKTLFQDEEDRTFVGVIPQAHLQPDAAFETLIYWRRAQFIADVSETRKLGKEDRDALASVERALKEVMGIQAIRFDLHRLANRNRRDMLASIIDFLSYVFLDDTKPQWDEIGNGLQGKALESLRWSSLKSLYYRWLVSGTNESRLSTPLSLAAFNPVKWIFDGGWQRSGNSYKLEAEHKALPAFVSSMLDYYIVACILNLSGDQAGWRYTTDLHRLFSIFSDQLGVPTDEIRTRLLGLVRAGSGVGANQSLLQISRFNRIVDGADTEPTDEVVVTDRTHCLLVHTCPMFSYIDELLNHRAKREQAILAAAKSSSHKVCSVDRLIELDPTLYRNRLVSKTQVLRMLDFIRIGLTHEVRNIEWFVNRRKASADRVVQIYFDLFAVKSPQTKARENTLLFHRILRTYKAFVSHCHTLAPDADRSFLKQALAAAERLDKYVREQVIKNIQIGRFELIPRDGPMNPYTPDPAFE